MTHRSLQELLPVHAIGELDEERSKAVVEHLAECEECSAWMAAHDVLAAALFEEDASSGHLSARKLSALAEVDAADLASDVESSAHLGACLSCYSELSLVREALEAARGATRDAEVAAWPLRRTETSSRLAWAALAVLAIGAVFVLGRSSEGPVPEASDLTRNGVISVEGRRVSSAMDITLMGNESVALGEGFSVDAGASFSVVVASDDTRQGISDRQTKAL